MTSLITVNSTAGTVGLHIIQNHELGTTAGGIQVNKGIVKIDAGKTLTVDADAAGATSGSAIYLTGVDSELAIHGSLDGTNLANTYGDGSLVSTAGSKVNVYCGYNYASSAGTAYCGSAGSYAGTKHLVWDTSSSANLILALQGIGGKANLDLATNPGTFAAGFFASGVIVSPSVVPAEIVSNGLYAIPLTFDTKAAPTGLQFTTGNSTYTSTATFKCLDATHNYPAVFSSGSLPQGVINSSVPLVIADNNTITHQLIPVTGGTGNNTCLTLTGGILDIETNMASTGILPATTSDPAVQSFSGLTSGSVTIGLTAAAAVDWSLVTTGTIAVPITIGPKGSLKI